MEVGSKAFLSHLLCFRYRPSPGSGPRPPPNWQPQPPPPQGWNSSSVPGQPGPPRMPQPPQPLFPIQGQRPPSTGPVSQPPSQPLFPIRPPLPPGSAPPPAPRPLFPVGQPPSTPPPPPLSMPLQSPAVSHLKPSPHNSGEYQTGNAGNVTPPLPPPGAPSGLQKTQGMNPRLPPPLPFGGSAIDCSFNVFYVWPWV